MNAKTQGRLVARVTELERTAVRLRVGVVTGTSPLAVTLGGSPVPIVDVRTVASGLTIGDTVAVLTSGPDMLVLGAIV